MFKAKNIANAFNVVGAYVPDVKGATVTEAVRQKGQVTLFYDDIHTTDGTRQVVEGLQAAGLDDKVKVGVAGGATAVTMSTRTYNSLKKANP